MEERDGRDKIFVSFETLKMLVNLKNDDKRSIHIYEKYEDLTEKNENLNECCHFR